MIIVLSILCFIFFLFALYFYLLSKYYKNKALDFYDSIPKF